MHRAETCRAKQERLNKPTIEPRLEIQTKSVVVCATYERTHSQATSELVVRQANFQKGRSVPGRPFSYGASAIGLWFPVVCSIRAAYRFSLVDVRWRGGLEIGHQPKLGRPHGPWFSPRFWHGCWLSGQCQRRRQRQLGEPGPLW